MKTKILVSLLAIMLFSVVMAGCTDDNGDDKGDKESDSEELPSIEYKMGDTWTSRLTSEDEEEPLTMTYTVSSVSFLYKGQTATVLSGDLFQKGYTDEETGYIYDDLTGTGTGYIDGNDRYIHTEREVTTKVKYSEYGDWYDVEGKRNSEYQYVGSRPSEASIGNTWTIKRVEEYEDRWWVDGDEVSSDSDNITQTRNYEIKGKKSVTVEAGTFNCFEIRYDVVEEETYSLMYYSPDAKTYVKIVEYEGTNIVNMEELISYSVS